LGDLVDPEDGDAYDWDNMVESSDMSVPDWYAYLGLLVEFMDRSIRVTAEGHLEAVQRGAFHGEIHGGELMAVCVHFSSAS